MQWFSLCDRILTLFAVAFQVQTPEEAQAGVNKKDYNSENVWVRFFTDGTFYPTNLQKLLSSPRP